MTIHPLRAAPPPALAAALERFEEQFTYPLGPGRTFRISHGADYPRFFRAMGEGCCFVAERGGVVLGVIGVAIRRVRLPNGDERSSLYLGDLKIAPEARAGRVLVRLADAVREWVGDRVESAFAVVMDGTRVTPVAYTGRLGIPAFRELAKVAVLRVPCYVDPRRPDGSTLAGPSDSVSASAWFADLTRGWVVCPESFPGERAEIAPKWLVAPDGAACGLLEDTRRAKRLFSDDGSEMVAAHLSHFAYRAVAAGVALLGVARREAAARGFPALFVAVPAADAPAFCEAAEPNPPSPFPGKEGGESPSPGGGGVGGGVVLAPATVFGTGFDPDCQWHVNTAEI